MWLGLGLLALLLGAFMIWAFHETSHVQVLTAPVTSGAIDRRFVATGTLEAVTSVQVGTQVSGVIQSLDVDYNSMVRTGQVLARLDPASYEAELLGAQAALAKAQDDALGLTTAVEDARTKLVRAEQLFTRQIIAQSDLDAAQIAEASATADLKAAESQIVEAEAAVHEAGVNLEHTIIRSPLDGIVVARNVDVGQTLAASVQSPVLFNIAADLKRMQVRVDVDESDVGGLNPGEPATFDVESYPDQTFKGTVSEVRLEPVLEQTAMAAATAASFPPAGVAGTLVSYTAIVDVANPDEKLRPGMTALVVLRGPRRDNTIRIPNSALSFRPPPEVLDAIGTAGMPAADTPRRRQDGSGGAGEVWRYDGRQFTPISVRTGLADDGWTELVSGPLHSGDPLVTGASVRRQWRISALMIH
jgi:HlyD family secretion protein